MKSSRKIFLCMSLALCAAGRAHALGLGDAVGTAVIGEPLRIEIPLFGSGSTAPAPSCFKVVPPLAEIGAEFVLRNARVDVVPDHAGAKLVVTTASSIREPLVGFAVSAGCEFGLTRDYVLLSAVPSPAAVAVTTPAGAPAPVAPAAAPPQAPAAPVAPVVAAPLVPPKTADASGETLRVDNETTLLALSRQKYPLQPKAREKFIRMMLQANPELADREASIAPGSVLQVPAGLPVRREGPPPGPKQAAPEIEQPVAAASPGKSKPSPGKDRLVLGAAPASSEAQLLDEAERLAEILLTQTKGQQELVETIARLEKNYADLRKEFVRVESQLAAVEAQRKAEKAAAGQSFDLFTLLGAVLGGGAMGGLLLHLYQRRRPKSEASANAPWWIASDKALDKPRPKPASRAQAAAADEGDALDFHTQPQTKP